MPLESYRIDCSDMYVEVNGQRHFATNVGVPNKHLLSFINAKIGVADAFFGKELNFDLVDFLTNRYVTCIPVNQHLLYGSLSKSPNVTLHIETDGQGKGSANNVTHYSAYVVYMVKQNVICEPDGRIRVEK